MGPAWSVLARAVHSPPWCVLIACMTPGAGEEALNEQYAGYRT